MLLKGDIMDINTDKDKDLASDFKMDKMLEDICSIESMTFSTDDENPMFSEMSIDARAYLRSVFDYAQGDLSDFQKASKDYFINRPKGGGAILFIGGLSNKGRSEIDGAYQLLNGMGIDKLNELMLTSSFERLDIVERMRSLDETIESLRLVVATSLHPSSLLLSAKAAGQMFLRKIEKDRLQSRLGAMLVDDVD